MIENLPTMLPIFAGMIDLLGRETSYGLHISTARPSVFHTEHRLVRDNFNIDLRPLGPEV